MLERVFIVLDINFKSMVDTSFRGTFSSIEAAFEFAYNDVKLKDGKNILVHNYQIDGEQSTETYLTNHNSLGSIYGISYNSYYGSYPCCRMIIESKIKN